MKNNSKSLTSRVILIFCEEMLEMINKIKKDLHDKKDCDFTCMYKQSKQNAIIKSIRLTKQLEEIENDYNEKYKMMNNSIWTRN